MPYIGLHDILGSKVTLAGQRSNEVINVKVYLQDSIMVDYFPTICLFVTKLGWLMPYIGLHDVLGSKVT